MDGPSAYENDALPVVGFCFQEPENDPRNFVYVWILRSENDIDSQEEKEHSLSNIALISLYAMAFQNKVSIYIPNVFYSSIYFKTKVKKLDLLDFFNSFKINLAITHNNSPDWFP